MPWRSPRPPPRTGPALAGLLALGGLAAIGYAVGRQLDAGRDGAGGLALGLRTGGVWPLLVGLGALGAAGYALTRRPAADFALALAGICLALFAGVPDVTVLAHAVAPTAGPAVVARTVVAAVIAVGFGVAAAAALRMRVTARAAPAARPSPADHGVVVGDITDGNRASRAP